MDNAGTVVLSAWSRDCNSWYWYPKGQQGIEVVEGYVPDFNAEFVGGGDELRVRVDIATGQILDWNPEMFLAKLNELKAELPEEEE